MANLYPFRALRYTVKAGELSGLTAPQGEPSPDAPPYSARLLLQGGTALLNRWREEGVLSRETMPALYLYEQEFSRFGRTCRVRGVVGLLEPDEDRVVLPQADAPEQAEEPLPVALAPLALLYRGQTEAALERMTRLSQAKPRYCFRQGNTAHRLWVVNDPVVLSALRQDLAEKPLLLAGSAARYKTFLRRGKPFPVFLMEAGQSGVSLAPYHCAAKVGPGLSAAELLRACAPYFTQIERENPQEISANLDALYRQGKTAFAVFRGGPRWTLMIRREEPAPRQTDRSIFCELVMKPLGIAESAAKWLPDLEQTMAQANGETGKTAFLLNPPRLMQVEALAAAGEKLPPDTVRFFPQLPDGVIITEEPV